MADAPNPQSDSGRNSGSDSGGRGTGPLPTGWLRRYPPLVTFVVALLIMFLVMPSALNLPQANPTTVLEYAPVPPEEDEPPPPPQDGSLSDLSLGSSDTLTTEASEPEELEDLPEAGDEGEAERPVTKQCVGDPPRQTEDPNSPPCVPFFEGDNGGETYQGVTGDEITVLVYTSGSISVGGDSGYEESPPTGSYCDVDKPANTQEECMRGEGVEQDHRQVRVTRALSRYFNERFQKYGRHVHFWVYYSSGSASPSSRRSDAQDNWETLEPFAVLDNAFFGGFNAIYAEAMTKRRVSVYGNFSSLANEFFKENAPFIWAFWPDVEHAVDLYVDYVCKRVAPFESSYAGSDSLNGQERRYGLLSTSDPGFDGLRLFADLATERFKEGCPNGETLDIVGEYKFPRHSWSNDTHPDAITKARENVAQMQSDRVTTVLWLQGYETEHSKAMDENGYYPEIMVAGDLLNDEIEESRAQNQEAWSNAWVMSNHLRQDRSADSPCREAYRASNPEGANSSDENSACGLYRAFFMLFRGIQVAGPFLTPDAVDQGNHSIPASRSTSPFVAACFFDPGDYSCVKDAHEAWWDPDAPDPDGDPEESGCYRMVDGGERYIAGTWPEGDAPESFADDQVCNNVTDGTTFVNPYGPAG